MNEPEFIEVSVGQDGAQNGSQVAKHDEDMIENGR